MKKGITLILTTLILTFALSGCTLNNVTAEKEPEPDPTIENFFAVEERATLLDEHVNALLADNLGVYSDISISAVGNIVTYSFFYNETYNTEKSIGIIKDILESTDFEPIINAEKSAIAEVCGIEPEKLTIRYYTNDANLIYTN